MLSEISQIEKDMYYIISLIGETFFFLKVQQTHEYYRKKQTHRYREHTSGF